MLNIKLMAKQKLGFTLVELLIVVGILAVLATVTVLILNPAQMIYQSRDSTRMNDLQTINKAINLSKAMGSIVDATQAKRVYISLPDTNGINDNCNVDYPALPALAANWEYRCVLSADLGRIDGFGWIPINFSSVPSIQPPLVVLPVDPINSITNFNYYAYGYDTDQNVYAIASKLDSEKYLADSALNDGGNDNTAFETRPVAWLAEGGGGGIGKYWVGGTGSWSDATNHWATSSGGAPGAGNVPTITDNCYFDASSFGAASQVVTVDVAANCADMDWTGVTNTPTFTGVATLNVYGSLTFSVNMTQTYSGTITFKATTTGETFTAAKQLTAAITFDGVGGGWQLQDNLNIGNNKNITLTNGSLDTNGVTVTCLGFISSNSNVRTLTLASSIINSGYWQIFTITNLTFNKGTSTIVIPTFISGSIFGGGGLIYNNLTINVDAVDIVSGANTFSNLTINGFATKTASVNFNNNQTITGTLTILGNSATNRLFIGSNTLGTPYTLTAATVSVTNADFQDITGAGAGNWNLSAITGGSGDAGGNTGITFTPAAVQTANGATSFSWSNAARWTSRVPLPQDDVVINNAFGISQTVTADMPRLGKNIDWTGATWTTGLTWTSSITINPTLFGSLTLISGLTSTIPGSNNLYFQGRSSVNTIKTFGVVLPRVQINNPGGIYTLQDNLSANTANGNTFNGGTFNASTYNITIGPVTVGNTSAATLLLGTGMWSVGGTGTVWSMSSGSIVTAGSSTLKITNTTSAAITFAGGSKIYNNIWFSRGASTASNTISGSNTFADFKDDGSAAHSILFTAGTTQTIATFTVSGTAGNLKTINSTTTGTHALVKSGVGTISSDYLNIQHSVATPASTWYAGANSVNNQAVATAGSGWIFTTPP